MTEKKGPPSLTVRTMETQLRSLSSIYQGRPIASPMEANESHDEYDKRCWRERCNALPDGRLFIPPQAFKGCIVTAASLLNEKIPGKGNQTWTKQFQCGVLVSEGIILPVTIDTVIAQPIFVPPDGKKGGSKRVWRTFPRIDQWEGKLTWYVTSPQITEEVFLRVLECAGLMVGVGSFRAEKGLHYGRFEVVSHKWQ